jgi:hypothetical protein
MEDFQQLLTGHTRQQMHLIEPIWLSEFKINERQVRSGVRICEHALEVLLLPDNELLTSLLHHVGAPILEPMHVPCMLFTE